MASVLQDGACRGTGRGSGKHRAAIVPIWPKLGLVIFSFQMGPVLGKPRELVVPEEELWEVPRSPILHGLWRAPQ